MKKKLLIFVLILLFSVGITIWYIKYDIQRSHELDRSKDPFVANVLCFFGDSDSCYELIWHNDYGPIINSYEKLKELCTKTGQENACFEVGESYAEGSSNVWDADANLAIYYFEIGCSTNSPITNIPGRNCSRLATMYNRGYYMYNVGRADSDDPWIKSVTVPIDLKKALYYNDRACFQGNTLACWSLAKDYKKGKFDYLSEKDKKSAIWEVSYYDSNERMSEQYLNFDCNRYLESNTAPEYSGNSSCVDLLKTTLSAMERIELHEKICAKESNYCYEAGLFYFKGEHVRQDLKKAKEYFGKACDDGKKEGCSEYAKLNTSGF